MYAFFFVHVCPRKETFQWTFSLHNSPNECVQKEFGTRWAALASKARGKLWVGMRLGSMCVGKCVCVYSAVHGFWPVEGANH